MRMTHCVPPLVLVALVLACQGPGSKQPTADTPQGPPPASIAPPPEVRQPEPLAVPPPPVHVNGERPPRPMPGAATLEDHDELHANPPSEVGLTPPPEVVPPSGGVP